MTFSLNGQLVLEVYVKKALEANRQGGIATPGQRDSVHGLKVLMDYHEGPDGINIPKGSTAYIREEILHTHGWASKPMSSPFLPCKFIIGERVHVAWFDIPDEKPAA